MKCGYLSAVRQFVTSLGAISQEETNFHQFKDSNPSATCYSREFETENRRHNSIPFHIQNTTLLQKSNNCLDVLGDLDSNIFTTTLQSQPSRSTSKRQSTASGDVCLVADFEKRKEIIHQFYNNILARNAGVEKSIDNFKRNCLQNQKINYDPDKLPSKGENYIEKITLQYLLQKFAWMIDPTWKKKNRGLFESQKFRAQSANSKYRSSISSHQNHSIPQSYGFKLKANQTAQKGHSHLTVSDLTELLKEKEESHPQEQPQKLPFKYITQEHSSSRELSQKQAILKTANTNKIRPHTGNINLKVSQRRFMTPERMVTEGRQQIDMRPIKFDGRAFENEAQQALLANTQKNMSIARTKSQNSIRTSYSQKLISSSGTFESLKNLSQYITKQTHRDHSGMPGERMKKSSTELLNSTVQKPELKYLNSVLQQLARPQEIQQYIRVSRLKIKKMEEDSLRSSLQTERIATTASIPDLHSCSYK